MTTEWILKLIDQVTGPADDIQDAVEGVRTTFDDVVEAVEKFDKETQSAVSEAIEYYKELQKALKEEQEHLTNLKEQLSSVNESLDEISKQKIEFDITEAEKNIKEIIKHLKVLDLIFDSVIEESKNISKETTSATKGLEDMLSSLAKFDFAKISLGGVVNLIKDITKATWAFIATPIGAAIATLGGIAIATKSFLDYNQEIEKTNLLTHQLTRLTGESLNEVRRRAVVIEEVYGQSINSTLTAAKHLSESFNTTVEDGMTIISEGLLRGGSNSDAFLKSLSKYPKIFAEAGFTMNEFRQVVNSGVSVGLYENVLPNAIKKFNSEIRKQSEGTKKIMENSLGKKFTTQLFAEIRDGSRTPKEALAAIAEEAEKIGLNIKQSEELGAKLFGSSAAEGGGFLDLLKNIVDATNQEERALTSFEEKLKRAEERALELAEAKDKAFNSSSAKAFAENWKEIWHDIKVISIDVTGWLIDGWNELAETLAAIVLSLQEIKNLWGDIKNLAGNMWDSTKDIGNVILHRISGGMWGKDDNITDIIGDDMAGHVREFLSDNAVMKAFRDEKDFYQYLRASRANPDVDPKTMYNWFKEYKKTGISASDYLKELQSDNSGVANNNDGKAVDPPGQLLNNDFGLTGVGGVGKSITMNLDIKNYFSVADKAAGEIERIADMVVGKINDRLKDAVITLG